MKTRLEALIDVHDKRALENASTLRGKSLAQLVREILERWIDANIPATERGVRE